MPWFTITLESLCNLGFMPPELNAITADGNLFAAQAANLNELFIVRLQSERVHFVTLSAALAHAEECPGGIFDDLNFRAHRLKEAASTFDFQDLTHAAGALERASFAAATSHAKHTDANVWTALVVLVDILGALDGTPMKIPNFPSALPTDWLAAD